MTDFLLPGEESRMRTGSFAPSVEPAQPDSNFLLDGEQPVQDRAASVLRTVIPTNPDKAAESRKLAGATGVPEDVVTRNLDTVKNQAQLQDVQRAMAASPILARQLTDPNFAKVAHDDAHNLSLTESLVNSFKRGPSALMQTLYGLNAADMQGNVNAIDKFNTLIASGPVTMEQLQAVDKMGLRYMTRERRAELRDRYASRLGASVEGIVASGAERAQYASPAVVDQVMKAKTFGTAFDAMMTDPLKFIAAIGPESLFQSAPGLLAAIPATMTAGPAGGMAAIGAGSFASDYGSSIIEGLADAGVNVNDINAINAAVKDPVLMAKVKDSALKHAGVVGAVDALSAGIASRSVLPKAIATKLASKPIATAAANMAVQTPIQAAMGAAGEAGGELAAGQQLQPGNILAEAAGEMFGTPGEVATMASHKLRAQFNGMNHNAVATEQNAQAIEQVLKTAEASKVRERDPSSFQSFVDAAAEEGPVQNIHVSAATFAQAAGDKLGELAQAMPSVAEQMPEAIAAGGDLVIPLGEFAAHVPGTGLEQSLIDHIRTSPDAMTREEAKTFLQTQAEQFHTEATKAVADVAFDTAFKQSAATVEGELLTQLQTANRFTDDVNKPYAKLAGAFYEVQAARLGITPEEMYVKYPLQVNAESVMGGARTMDQTPKNARGQISLNMYAAMDAQGKMLGRVSADSPQLALTAAQSKFPGATSVGPRHDLISLLHNADLSTFTHELGHFQLEVLSHMADLPDAPAGIKDDMGHVLNWFGVKDKAAWNSMTMDQKRPHHEQLARGFEAYLFEGKAPNVELQGVFSRMRAWMINVYKSLSALKVNLTPEVRGVFDRLIATNEEILAAEAQRNYAPLFKSAEEMGATPAEWQAYMDQNQEQTQAAIDQLGARSLKDMRWTTKTHAETMRVLQKDANAKRAVIEAEVKTEVQQQPVYAAQHFLKTGEMVSNGEHIKIEKGAKLDTAALKEMYPDTMLSRPDLTGLQGMTRADGLHPDLVAQMFGFTSGDQMVRDMLAAQPEAVTVEGMTDQRMLERYGDLSDPAAISRAADAAIHNEAHGRFIATELSALAKATGQSRVLVKAAKAFAATIIARKKIRDVRPAQYSAAEARASKAAEKAKTLTEKMTEKRNQLVNHHTARAAYDAVAEVESGLALFKRLDGNEKIDIAYREQIDQMLERFDLRSGQSLKAIDKRTALDNWIKAQEDIGFSPIINDELRNEALRKSYKNMTVEEFRGLVDAIKNIEHLGRLKNKLLTAKDQREFAAVVSQITQSIEDNATKTIPEQRASDRGVLVSMRRLFDHAAAIHRKFASLVRGFDGFKDGGVAWENLVRNMNEQGNFEAVENEKATMALTKLLSPVMKGEKLTSKTYFPNIGKSFTREERIGVALNMGNEINRERVISGENLTPQQLDSILATVTKQEWDFAQGVWDYFDTFKPQIAAKERRVTGTEPEWVDAAPVHTPHGGYKGGYYPIAYDSGRSERSHADINAEVTRQMQQGLYTRAQTRRGHTKARSESTGRALRYDFGEVITNHVSQVVHDLAWHEYLIDANRLLRAGAIEGAVKAHHGGEVLREMKDTLRDIAMGTIPAEKGAVFWNHLRYGTTIAGLGYNVFNTLQNITGITQSMSRVGTGWVFKGAAHWAGDAARFQNSSKEINAKSDFMRLRAKTMQRDINDIRNKVSGKDSKLMASFFYLQTKTQMIVDIPTWWGAYEKAMSQDAMTEDKAVALADQAVTDAQGSGQIKDLAGIQRGGAGMKAFTTFYSFFNTTFNLTAEAYGRTNFKKPGDIALFTADMVLLYSLPALLSTLLKAAMEGSWDDPDKLGKKIVGDQISFLMGTVIGLREAAAGVQAATGSGEGFGYTGPASVRFFSDLFKLGTQIHQGEADEPFWKSLDNVGGVLFHYPAGQLNRTASGIAALNDGRTKNPMALLMGAPHK